MSRIEEQTKNIEEKKHLLKLAGINFSEDNPEEVWKKLQKEMEYIIHLAKNKINK